MPKFLDDDPDEDIDPDRPTDSRRRAKAGASKTPPPSAEDETELGATERFRRIKPGTEGSETPDLSPPLPVGWLVIIDGPGVGNVVTLLTGTMTIGRGGKSTAKLDFGDREISREDHARFDYDRVTREFHIMPGRGPETRLGGKKVLQPEKLTRGALLTLGATTLRFAPFCDEAFDWTAGG